MLESQRCAHDFIRYPRYSIHGWIGVDLDGTLAEAGSQTDTGQIGAPVPQMIKRVRYWIKTGRTVKIFTARAGDPQQVWMIHQWCALHGLPRLEVTNSKDVKMIALWDSRAVGVVKNIGVPILPVRMNFWQSLRLRLMKLMLGNAVMNVDETYFQGYLTDGRRACRTIFESDE